MFNQNHLVNVRFATLEVLLVVNIIHVVVTRTTIKSELLQLYNYVVKLDVADVMHQRPVHRLNFSVSMYYHKMGLVSLNT